MVKAKSKQVESPAKKKVVLIDDHPIFRRGLKELIEAEEHLEVVGEAASSQQALDVIKRSEADLVICDISLDGTGGLELIKQVQAQHNDSVKFLVCSVHDECIFAERALQAGASGYVQKSEEPTIILMAVDRVLDGRTYVSDAINDQLLQRAVHGQEEVTHSPVDALSDRELEVFELTGRGWTTKKIAEKLHLSPKTVETYRQHIKRKLNLKNTSELPVRAAHWVMKSANGEDPLAFPHT